MTLTCCLSAWWYVLFVGVRVVGFAVASVTVLLYCLANLSASILWASLSRQPLKRRGTGSRCNGRPSRFATTMSFVTAAAGLNGTLDEVYRP